MNYKLFPFRNFGFTFAEVLITLAVIGVVAAMTLPVLIQKHNEKVWTTSFLRVYSILDNIYKSMLDEYGPLETWPEVKIVYEINTPKVTVPPNKEFIYNAMKPHLNITEEFTDPKVPNCMAEKNYYINGKINTQSLNANTPTVMLNSGECIAFGAAHPAHHSFFWVDINGRKAPNTLGKDQFLFHFTQKRIAPMGWSDVAYDCIDSTSDTYGLGKSCGAWIVRYHNMDYLHLSDDEIKKRWGANNRYWE